MSPTGEHTAAQWFVESAGQRLGPYTLEQLKAALAAGKLAPQVQLITAEAAPGAIEKRLTLAEAIEDAKQQSRERGTGGADPTMTLFDALQATKTIQRERHHAHRPPQLTVVGAPAPESSSFSVNPRLLIALGATVVVSMLIWAATTRKPTPPNLAGSGAKGGTSESLNGSASGSALSGSAVNSRSAPGGAPSVAGGNAPGSSFSPPPALAPPTGFSSSSAAAKPNAPAARPNPMLPRSFGAINPSGGAGVSSNSNSSDDRELEREREKDREYEREREREKRRQMEAWGNPEPAPSAVPRPPDAPGSGDDVPPSNDPTQPRIPREPLRRE